MRAFNAPTYNYEADAAALARKMKLAEVMQAQGLQMPTGTEMAGRVAIQRSPMEYLAKVAQAYMGGKQVESLDEERKQLGGRYQADLQSGIGRFIDGISTKPGMQPEQHGNNPSAYQAPTGVSPVEAQQAKMRAVMEAIGSNHPVLQQIGMSQLTEMQKNGLTVKDLLPHATGASAKHMVTTGSTAGFEPKVELRGVQPGELTVGDDGNIRNPGTPGQPKPSGPIVPQGWKHEGTSEGGAHLARDPGGDLYQQTATGWKKLDNAPKISVSPQTNVFPAGQKAGAEHFWKNIADQVEKYNQAATAASLQKQSLAELKNLESQGINSGVPAPAATWVQNFAQSIGVPLTEKQIAKLGNSEGFNSVATELWQNVISKSGGNRGVTKEEAMELKNITPQLANSPEARLRMYAILERAADRAIKQHEAAHYNYTEALQAQDFKKVNPALFNASMPQPQTPNPAVPGAVPPTVLTLDQYIQSRKGK